MATRALAFMFSNRKINTTPYNTTNREGYSKSRRATSVFKPALEWATSKSGTPSLAIDFIKAGGDSFSMVYLWWPRAEQRKDFVSFVHLFTGCSTMERVSISQWTNE